PVAEITIPATQGVDPSQYFQTREGLYVWPEFSERIVSVAKKTELPEVTFRSFELVKSANDTEIRSELPEDYVLEASELCGYLPEIIASQPGGEEGFLLTNGHPNVFYVRGRNGEVFAVGVLWDGVNLEWDVYADRLDDGHWSGGYRVISLATV
ncbi:MAG: hypothetical protein Q8P12_00965, partial [bacterium]|nr:hypothetical protein [bacterium]